MIEEKFTFNFYTKINTEIKDEFGNIVDKVNCKKLPNSVIKEDLIKLLNGSINIYLINPYITNEQFEELSGIVIKQIEHDNDDDYTSWRFVNKVALYTGSNNEDCYAYILSFRIRDSY